MIDFHFLFQPKNARVEWFTQNAALRVRKPATRLDTRASVRIACV